MLKLYKFDFEGCLHAGRYLYPVLWPVKKVHFPSKLLRDAWVLKQNNYYYLMWIALILIIVKYLMQRNIGCCTNNVFICTCNYIL